MLKIIDNEIHLTKGDTAYLSANIVDDNGMIYKMQEGDTLTLTVKKNLNASPVITKTVTNDEVIAIHPVDTKNLAVGRYKYDIQLNTALEEVFTIIPASDFYLEQEVTE